MTGTQYAMHRKAETQCVEIPIYTGKDTLKFALHCCSVCHSTPSLGNTIRLYTIRLPVQCMVKHVLGECFTKQNRHGELQLGQSHFAEIQLHIMFIAVWTFKYITMVISEMSLTSANTMI